MSKTAARGEEIRIAIRLIKDISFFIKEELIVERGEKEILVQFVGKHGYNIEKSLLNFTLNAWYHYKGEEDQLAAIEVANIFFIENLEKLVDKNKQLNLPNNVWVTIVQLAISHTRALFSKNLLGTALQEVVISITDPVTIVKQFFPETFKSDTIVGSVVKAGKPRSPKKTSNQKIKNV